MSMANWITVAAAALSAVAATCSAFAAWAAYRTSQCQVVLSAKHLKASVYGRRLEILDAVQGASNTLRAFGRIRLRELSPLAGAVSTAELLCTPETASKVAELWSEVSKLAIMFERLHPEDGQSPDDWVTGPSDPLRRAARSDHDRLLVLVQESRFPAVEAAIRRELTVES